MGIGDQIIGTGLAKGAADRGKRIAFGDGRKIIWDHNSDLIFRGNPNIAPLGSEKASDIEWVHFYRGNRLYNRVGNGRWIWDKTWKCKPGEVYLTEDEKRDGLKHGSDFIVIEPNVENWKPSAKNKDWGANKYQNVAAKLTQAGYRVVQFDYPRAAIRLKGIGSIQTKSFREAVSVLSNAAMYIGPEGGLHHAAAAVGIPGVVIFGGFLPPSVTGYDMHVNLTGGVEACGSFSTCEHCRKAMESISAEEVISSSMDIMMRRT